MRTAPGRPIPLRTRGARLLAAAGVLVAPLPALVGLSATSAAAPAAAAPASAAACDEQSWTAGTVELCAGELVYRDYVVDDFGADDGSRPTQPSSLAPAAGDARYPAGLEQSADLVTLRLGIVGDRLRITALTNALTTPRAAVVAVAIDTDANAATGGGQWRSVAYDFGVRSQGWERLLVLDVGDPATNTLTADFPLPAGTTWRVQAVAAKPDGTVMNLAFRGAETTAKLMSTWFENRQSALLRDGDISTTGATVSVADLRRGITRRAPLVTGFQERVYRSAFTLAPGEGFSYGGVPGRHPGSALGDGGGSAPDPFRQDFQLLGHYQPYGVYVPKRPGPYGVQLVMHGLNANMSSLVDQPGMQTRFGEELGRIVVVPEGRGKAGYYSDISERDVLDVLDDVLRVYPVDRTRVFSGGYSMGGYGAMRLATLHPDRFAGVVQWVGFTGDCSNNPATPGTGLCQSGAVGNVIELLGNLRHVPMGALYSGGDYLVHANSGLAIGTTLAETDTPHAFWFHPAAEHLTYVATDDWRKEAAYSRDLRLVRNPARVSFRTDLDFGNKAYGISHDKAYWLRSIRSARAGYTTLDATSGGCAPVTRAGTTQGAGVDPVPWVLSGRGFNAPATSAPTNALTLTATNLASVVIDTAGACLTKAALTYRITSDVPVTMTFSDGRRLTLPSGTSEGVLAAVGARSRPVAARPLTPTVAATGGSTALPVVGAAGFALALMLRRLRRPTCGMAA